MDLKIVFLIKDEKLKKLALQMYYSTLLQKQPKRLEFQLSLISTEESVDLFRFTPEELKLLRGLLKIPPKFICPNGTTCSGLEGLCIVLRRLTYPNRYVDLSRIFYRPNPELSMIFNGLVNVLSNNFGHLLTDLNQWWLSDNHLQVYAEAVHKKGAPLRHCWGFIDGTVRPICRPTEFQRECYNGHKRVHSLKYQAITTPDGLIANLFGPVEGRRHDAYLLSKSGILPILSEKNHGKENPFYVYGDPAYPLRPELQAPYRGTTITELQKEFNKRMSSCRISVEWSFGKVLSLFAFVDFKKNQKLYLQPVGNYFQIAVLFTNIHTCINGSKVSDFFGLDPPEIQMYLN